jgi:hypothetical protein
MGPEGLNKEKRFVPRMLSLVVYTCGMRTNLLKPGAKSSATYSPAAGGV